MVADNPGEQGFKRLSEGWVSWAGDTSLTLPQVLAGGDHASSHHGCGFWATLEARFAAEPIDQTAPPPPPVALPPDRLLNRRWPRCPALAAAQGISVGSPSSMIAGVPGTRSEQPEPYGAGTNITVMTGGAGYLFTVSQGAITEWSVGTPAGLGLTEACS